MNIFWLQIYPFVISVKEILVFVLFLRVIVVIISCNKIFKISDVICSLLYNPYLYLFFSIFKKGEDYVLTYESFGLFKIIFIYFNYSLKPLPSIAHL